jgi:hypothetical protein
MTEELLVVKKNKEKVKYKIVERQRNGWSPSRYEKVLNSRDFNQFAYLLLDLHNMGYPIDKAYSKFKKILNDPELFFL